MSGRTALFARRQTAALLEKLASHAEDAQSDPTPEVVHNLRVTVRRVKAALRVFRPEFTKRDVRRLRAELDEVMDAAGPLRDLDVGLELLSSARVPVRSEMVKAIRQQRETAADDLRNCASVLSHAGRLKRRLGV